MTRLAIQGVRLRSLPFWLAYTLLLGSSNPVTIASPLDLTFPNLTSLAAHDPDSRFKLTPHFTDQRLPATAVLMSTVYLLAEVADLDINDDLEFNTPYVNEDYPSVSIGLQNARASVALPVAFLVWGLYYVAMGMIEHNKFFVSSYDVLWKGRIVGRLQYQKPEPDASFGGSANISHSFIATTPSNHSAKVSSDRSYPVKKGSSQTIAAPLDSSSEAVNTMAADPLLTIHMLFLPDAKTLSIGTVFAMIIEQLKDNAEYPAGSWVQSSSTTIGAFDATLEIQRKEGPSMTTPPFFEYAFLNRAIRQVPRLMLTEKKFAEVTFWIEVDKKE
ncbi:MAG: hypothetical protein Q9195_008454 [Heterodermia aff. obscurata]